MKSSLLHDRFEANNRIAALNRADFEAANVVAISVVGPAGGGKTSAIERLLTRLDPRVRAAAIVGNLAADRQISRITRHGFQAIPIFTDNIAAAHVREGISRLNLPHLDLVLIEADGNALSPVEFDLGQKYRIAVFSAAGGDDKATEHPFLVAESDLVLLTKGDLLPFVTFDLEVFHEDVRRLKGNLEIIQGSSQTETGMDRLVRWVQSHLPGEIQARQCPSVIVPFVDWIERR